MQKLTLEEVLKELNPAEKYQALMIYYDFGEALQEIKEFFDSL